MTSALDIALPGSEYGYSYDWDTGAHMKTTIEISDPVLNDARRLATREGVTLRALVELGLRRLIAEKKRAIGFRLRRASYKGNGLQWSPSGPPRRLLGAPARDGLRRAWWMIAVDTNVLVYAHREGSPFHEHARDCLDSLANGRAAWAIPWPCLQEFLSIVTHPRVYDPPTPLAFALDQIDAWLEAPSLVLLAETESHGPELRTLVESGRVAGPRYTTRASPPCAGNMASANCGRRTAISVGSPASTSATHS